MRSAFAMPVLVAASIVACGPSPSAAAHVSPSPRGAASAPADPATLKFVTLVRDYWIAYKFAEGDLDTISASWNGVFSSQDAARLCGGLTARTQPPSLPVVDPAECGQLSAAMVAVHEKFLSDLNTTPPPPRFAADDQAIKNHLPKAITDMKTMISAAARGDKQAVMDATWVYADDMIPAVTHALDDVDPSVTHD